jgi:phenylalanyl-tRNA synthetase alpha chain
MSKNIVINDPNEGILIKGLEERSDIKAERIKRLLKLPDLTKKENSPVKILTDAIVKLPRFSDFDLLDIPRVVTIEDDFDLLNTPKDHPSRRETDTYYLDDTHILRTQMTVMWPYYLRNKEVLKRLETEGHIAALAPGIVFRKDEIDKNHFPAFHQIDFLYICRKEKKIITQKDLEEVQADSIKAIFGNNIEFRFLVDSFPFTDPSIQLEIKFNDKWMEVTGAGLVHTQCLKNFGLDSEIYNGWAFSFGIERLAMIKMGISDIRIFWSNDERITSQFKNIDSKFKEVSKYPETSRDISFIIDKSVNLNNYYEIVRDFVPLQRDPVQGGTEVPIIEEVKLLDEYEDDVKFGADKKSYTFRITYCSPERTLTAEEVNKIQEEIRNKTVQDLNAILR